MALPPFERVLFDPAALSYLGSVPQPVKECLKGAFEDLKERRLELEPPVTWRSWDGPVFSTACQHLIFASESPDQKTLVVLEILPDVGGDNGDV